MKDDLIVVCGAGGFIGGHLVADFLQQGHTRIRAVDIKPLDRWYQRFDGVENFGSADLKSCRHAAGLRKVLIGSTILRPIWVGWDLSKTIKRSACSAC